MSLIIQQKYIYHCANRWCQEKRNFLLMKMNLNAELKSEFIFKYEKIHLWEKWLKVISENIKSSHGWHAMHCKCNRMIFHFTDLICFRFLWNLKHLTNEYKSIEALIHIPLKIENGLHFSKKQCPSSSFKLFYITLSFYKRISWKCSFLYVTS